MAEITKIRFDFIGRAKIVHKVSHALALAPIVVLHAVGSRSFDKGFSVVAKVYSSYEAVLDIPSVDMDIVYVLLPTTCTVLGRAHH